jgi:lipid II isoglutaminyl synthase (glutamine-hydrolysing)
MIGGLVAMTLDRSILRQLGTGRRTVVVTGTNGKSTTTRMTAAALRTLGGVATNAEGANMDAGLVAALAADRNAALAVLEVDEMHVPHVADAVEPAAIVLLNLSRDQLDRVGEINVIERRLRAGLAAHPQVVVVANCDDVGRLRPRQRVLGGGGRQLGGRLGQLPAQRRGDHPRAGSLVFHRS